MRTAVLTALSLLLTSIATAQGPPASAGDAGQLLALTNQDRAAHGLPPLAWSQALAEAAQAHAEQIVRHRDLEHDFPGEPSLAARVAQTGEHFRSVAENIAANSEPSRFEAGWMASPEHRANILDPRLNEAGVAIVRSGSVYYAVEDFATAIPSLSSGQIESRVAALLRQQGIASVRTTQAARQSCEMSHGWAGGPEPLFIMRWEGSDLSHLPAALVQRLGQQRVHSAAVGACGSSHPDQPFTSYHVAVLLY